MRGTSLLLLVLLLLAPVAPAGPLKISTGKLSGDYAWTPLEFEIRGVPDDAEILLKDPGDREVPCQVSERSPGSLRIVWVAPRLAKGGEGIWDVSLVPVTKLRVRPRVEVAKDGSGAIAIRIDGKEFTRLLAGPDDAKPYLFPIFGPNGKMITRRFPMEKGVAGEDQDHPHQRSLWFTHGAVGGVDFWAEGKGKGRIRQVEVKEIVGGAVSGRISTRNEWLAEEGRKILDETRVYTVYPLERGEVLLDLSIALTPAGGPVLFGDTKEGTFGIRLAESMKETRGGTIVNSRGQRGMKEAWGKPAEWVDYSGKVDGDLVGVAILDHPKSFRHPTTWHVRDYGLFAANPFGYEDFKYGDRKGDFTLEPGKTLEFRYRVYFHGGGADEAKVAEVYRGFAEPPALHPRA